MNNNNLDGMKPDQLARLSEMLDRQDIRDCVERISRGMDRFDKKLFLSGYHEDAVVDAGGLVEHPEAVYAHGSELHRHGQKSTLHYLLNQSCDFDGDTAHAETYYFYAALNQDDTNWVAGGRYIDRIEKRNGEWRVAFRYTIIEWSGAVPTTSVPLFDNIPDLHLNGFPSRSPEDPSYRRPLTNLRALTAPENSSELGFSKGTQS